MNDALTGMQKFIEAFVGIAANYGMDIVQAIVTLIVGYWLVGKLRKAIRRWLDRFERVDSPLKPLFANIVR